MPRTMLIIVIAGVMMMATPSPSEAQRPGINQDETKVPEYSLPESLVCQDGSQVDSAQMWISKRRPEILQLFADHVYGNVPARKVAVEFRTRGESWQVLDGTAIRREIQIVIGDSEQPTIATMLITLPVSKSPVPCFVGYNFHGNHTTTSDPRVATPTSWVRNDKKTGAEKNLASDRGRGATASRWPYSEVLEKGFGVATIYYGDIDPDFDDGFQNGIHPHFFEAGQTSPTKNQWGSIGAWAWGLSRAMDFFETDSSIDSKRIAVIGHSRLGKTSLWAGARDERFALVISNNSGCGGAALSRRRFGETVKVINKNFPHWFCNRFSEYDDKEDQLPVDQHMLIALMAPRPVYVASASKDLWADPKGEFLALAHADDVFQLFGNRPMSRQHPESNVPLMNGKMGYHLRAGKHDIKLFDWLRYIEYAETVWQD